MGEGLCWRFAVENTALLAAPVREARPHRLPQEFTLPQSPCRADRAPGCPQEH